MQLIRLWMLLGLGFLPLMAWAQNQAEVTAVQGDVWVFRGDAGYPGVLKMKLKSGDQIRTGEKSRAILKLPDDSTVKIGAYALLNLEKILPPEQEDGVFTAALDVLRGAFRFTAETPAKRDVTIKIGKSITAGIRGTDIWGSAWLNKNSILCLLEGKVEVSAGDVKTVMDQPLDYFIVPEGKAPLPVGKLSPEKLKKWAKWTDLIPAE